MLLFQTSREIKFYFQHFLQVCFWEKKTGGRARAPLPCPLATALLWANDPSACFIHRRIISPSSSQTDDQSLV